MTIQLTADGLRKIFPKAPQDILDAFVAKQDVLDRVGVTHTRTRLSYFFANIEHECGGFTIRNLTENTNYSADRAVQVWPSRFKSAADCYAKVGSFAGDPDFHVKLLDNVYGNRMGNRPGTHDGSTFIGRGGPQWTGRDGYAELQRRTALQVVASPEIASAHTAQPEVCAAFWDWKKLNAKADAGDFKGAVRLWNGGQIGLADREAAMAGNDPYIARLQNVDRILPAAKELPGAPPTPAPPKEVLDDATAGERKLRTAGAGSVVAGGGSEVVKTQTGTTQAHKQIMTPIVTYSLIGVGVAIVIVAAILIARKQAAVFKNWF